MSRRKTLLIVATVGLAIVAGVCFLPRGQRTDGYVVQGTLACEDRREIENLMRQQMSDPVRSIRPAGFDRWEVWTGVLRGPLDGGGDIFVVERRFGKWKVVEESRCGWVS